MSTPDANHARISLIRICALLLTLIAGLNACDGTQHTAPESPELGVPQGLAGDGEPLQDELARRKPRRGNVAKPGQKNCHVDRVRYVLDAQSNIVPNSRTTQHLIVGTVYRDDYWYDGGLIVEQPDDDEIVFWNDLPNGHTEHVVYQCHKYENCDDPSDECLGTASDVTLEGSNYKSLKLVCDCS